MNFYREYYKNTLDAQNKNAKISKIKGKLIFIKEKNSNNG